MVAHPGKPAPDFISVATGKKEPCVSLYHRRTSIRAAFVPSHALAEVWRIGKHEPHAGPRRALSSPRYQPPRTCSTSDHMIVRDVLVSLLTIGLTQRALREKLVADRERLM